MALMDSKVAQLEHSPVGSRIVALMSRQHWTDSLSVAKPTVDSLELDNIKLV